MSRKPSDIRERTRISRVLSGTLPFSKIFFISLEEIPPINFIGGGCRCRVQSRPHARAMGLNGFSA